MRPYRLPIKFILLWIVNLAVLLVISITTGFLDTLLSFLYLKDLTWIYLLAGGILAGLEQLLIDKLKGNE